MRAAMMLVTAGLRLVTLLLAIRRLLVPTALRMVRILAPPMLVLPKALAIPLPMLAPLKILTPMLPRTVRTRAPMLVIPRQKTSLLPASRLGQCWDGL